MRLDKFLKVSRIIKRRTVAKDASDAGVITVNGREAKAATRVKVGDELSIQFGNKTVYFRVLQLMDHVPKDQADTMYEVIENGSINP